MKAFVIQKPGIAVIMDIDKQLPSDGEILVKVKAAGFCGTDIHTFKGEHPSRYPLIPGHEFSGIVDAVGAGVTKFKIGDSVICDPNIFCEKCTACKSNHQIHCESIKVIGNTQDGAFAEYVRVPEQCAFHSEGIDFVQGSMAEPLGCVINAHNKFDLPIGSDVLIFGAGTIGLMHLLLSSRRGAARVIMVDVKPQQLELAQQLGAGKVLLSTPKLMDQLKVIASEGFQVVIDATGVPKVVEQAISLLSDGGIFVGFGACPVESSITINPFDLYYHDWKLIGSYALEKTLPQAIAMISKGGMDLSPLIGEQISLEQMPEKFRDFVEGKTNNKIIVCFD